MTSPLPWPSPPVGQGQDTGHVVMSADWLRLARLARLLSWLTLAWMGIEGGVAIGAAVVSGSVALLGFGLDSGIEAMASVIVIWRFTGTRLASRMGEETVFELAGIRGRCDRRRALVDRRRDPVGPYLTDRGDGLCGSGADGVVDRRVV